MHAFSVLAQYCWLCCHIYDLNLCGASAVSCAVGGQVFCIFDRQDFVWGGSALLTALIVRHGQSFACWWILLQWQRAPSPVFYLCVCVCVCTHMCVRVCAHECVCACVCVCVCVKYSAAYSSASTFFVFIFSVVFCLVFIVFLVCLQLNNQQLYMGFVCVLFCSLSFVFLSFSRWCTCPEVTVWLTGC